MKTAIVLLSAAFFGAGLLAPSTVLGCAWDSDTLRDEAQQNASDFDLVTGQFPHHGDGYYATRIRRLTAAGAPAGYQERNDLAVAHLRLEHWKDAQALLDANLSEKPGDYFTLSNLGILAKKQGNYALAAEWIAKALAAKPEGHLGLGDWYLQALRYRAARAENPKEVPALDFLGRKYADSFHPALSTVDTLPPPPPGEYLARLRRLLENDQSFADGFLVAGDYFAGRGELNLALLCYRRASALHHLNPAEVKRRADALMNHFIEIGFDSNRTTYRKYAPARRAAINAGVTLSFTKAAAWLESFKKVEGELAKLQSDQSVTPETVETEMARKGLKRYRP